MVCARSTASTPEVGFCLGASDGISSRFTVQTARMGMPLEANRVYLALTWVTTAGKLLTPPHLNTTIGGIGLFGTVLSRGTQQLNSFSTASTTLKSDLSAASK